MNRFDRDDMTTQIGVMGVGLILLFIGLTLKRLGFLFTIVRFVGLFFFVYGIYNIIRLNKKQ